MTHDRIEEIQALLVAAAEAHGRYEAAELNGVYDQAWAEWYAGYIVEQGISALLGHAVTVEQVTAFFTRSFAEYQRDNIREAWATYTARRMQAEL